MTLRLSYEMPRPRPWRYATLLALALGAALGATATTSALGLILFVRIAAGAAVFFATQRFSTQLPQRKGALGVWLVTASVLTAVAVAHAIAPNHSVLAWTQLDVFVLGPLAWFAAQGGPPRYGR